MFILHNGVNLYGTVQFCPFMAISLADDLHQWTQLTRWWVQLSFTGARAVNRSTPVLYVSHVPDDMRFTHATDTTDRPITTVFWSPLM